MVTDGVLGASWLPTDGYLDPSQLTYALADGARRGGCADLHAHARDRDRRRATARVRGVRTERGDIEADVVVNAGGMYAAEIGRLAGVRVPVVPFAHEYLVTQPFRERASRRRAPADACATPTCSIYFREEGGGLVMGGYERDSRAVVARRAAGSTRSRPTSTAGCSRRTGTASRRSSTTRASACRRWRTSRVTRLINGPEAFTPDGEFCLGETEVRGFFVAAGFCAHGLAGAGGIGKVMAEWIAEGEPPLDLWHMDVRRFGAQYRSPRYTLGARARGLRDLLRHQVPRPRAAGRAAAADVARVRRGMPRTAPRSARRRAGSGSTGTRPTRRRATRRCARAAGRGSTGRRRSAPSTAPAARRPRCSTSPRSPSSRSPGPGAAEFLERLCDNRVARDVGQGHLHADAQPRGGIECDFTVTRLAEDRFWIVTGTAFGSHDLAWIRRARAARTATCASPTSTSQWACFALWGPRARDDPRRLHAGPTWRRGFPYMTVRGHRRSATCRCARCG